MTPRLMSSPLPSRLLRHHHAASRLRSAPSVSPLQLHRDATGVRQDVTHFDQNGGGSPRTFAHVTDIDRSTRDIWFTSSAPHQAPQQNSDHKPPDERTLQLGKTIRVLHERLPTLLQSPLPAEILSPQISLHLFPSTHPHLPTVSGRIAYNAALWTAPVAWGRMPLIGNVKLTILSERMVRHGGSAVSLDQREERLVVKWKTCGKTRHRDPTGGVYNAESTKVKDPMDRIKDFIAGATSGDAASKAGQEEEQEFCGLFIFEFDEKGRIIKHTIEHTDEGGHWDHMTRVVSVTDWLLGRINGKGKEQVPELALCEDRPRGWREQHVTRRDY